MNSIGAILAWLLGIMSGLLIAGMHPEGLAPDYAWWLLGLGVLLLIPLLFTRGDRRARWSCILLMALLLGCGRALLVRSPLSQADLAYYNGAAKSSSVHIEGEVTAEPVYLDTYQRLRISARSIQLSNEPQLRAITGDMLVELPLYPLYYIGDQVLLTGKVTAPPSGSFDYATYLARHNVFSFMSYPQVKRISSNASGGRELVSGIRARVRSAIEASMPEPEASLTVGIVTGDRTAMSPAVLDAFNGSGTTQILAISGQNISLLVGFAYVIFGVGTGKRRMPAWLVVALLLVLVIYTLLTGATPSVIRAAIMSAVVILSQLVGRRFDPVSALSVSAALMTLDDPNLLLDSGFLLSFAAMWGLTEISPFINAGLYKLSFPRWLSLPLSAGFGAQAATAPLLLLLTGRVSPVGPFATFTTELTLLPLMIAGIALGIIGAIVPLLGTILGVVVWPWAAIMLASVEGWSSLPMASLQIGSLPFGWIACYYLLLVLLVWWLKEGRRRLRVSGYQAAFAAVGVACWCVALGMLLS